MSDGEDIPSTSSDDHMSIDSDHFSMAFFDPIFASNSTKTEDSSANFLEEPEEPQPTLVSLDSLKYGFFETPTVAVIRLTHRGIEVHQIIAHPDSLEIHFTSSCADDRLLKRYGPFESSQTFLWHCPLQGLIEANQIEFDGKEIKMRKSESGSWNRLSSSTSSIRSSNYTPSRSYGSSLSSYRYTPSYSSGTTTSYTTPYGSSAAADRSLTRSSTTHSATSRSLTRSDSSSAAAGSTTLPRTNSSSATPTYHRSLYSTSTGPTATSRSPFSTTVYTPSNTYQRESSFTRLGDTSTYSRNSSSTLDRSRDSGYSGQSSASSDNSSMISGTHTLSSRDQLGRPRASSQIITSGYRGPSVRELNRKASERANRELQENDYREWEDRDRLRAQIDTQNRTPSPSRHESGKAMLELEEVLKNRAGATSPSLQMMTSPRTRVPTSTTGHHVRWDDRWERDAALGQLTNKTKYQDEIQGHHREVAGSSSINGHPLKSALRSSNTFDTFASSPSRHYDQQNDDVGASVSKAPAVPAYPPYLQNNKVPSSRSEPITIEPQGGQNPAASQSPPTSPTPTRSYLKKEIVHRDLVTEYTRKPTAKVSPYEESGQIVSPGFTGLRNIGNTCFMNATLQMLVNNAELKAYFLQDLYKRDVNEHNMLGFGGRLANAFAQFMRQMWSCTNRAVEPVKIKELVAEKASQFANFAQHDAHEFLSFLLDGLHEDTNRVRSKVATNTVEANGRPDREVAAEAWRTYLLRNDSIFVDLFHGQLKSRLECPRCSRVSITFDPFVYLPVPFPKKKKTVKILFWPLDPALRPIRLSISFSPEGNVADFLTAVGELVKQPSKHMRLIEIVQHRIHKVYTSDEPTNLLSSGDTLYVYQVHDPQDWNEDIVELYAVQRQLYAHSLKYVCNACGSTQEKLKSCEACYNAWYCDQDCQLKDWNEGSHRGECGKRATIDSVGGPILVSLPRSHLTYAHLVRVLDARSRHSIQIFLPPQLNRSSSDHSCNGETEIDGIPPSSSGSTINGEASTDELGPITTTDGSASRNSLSPSVNGSSSELRRQVMPAPRKKPPPSLFIVKRLRSQASNVGDTVKENKEGDPLDLPSGSYLSVNWINLKNGKPYVEVESKIATDIDENLSNKYANGPSGSRGGDGDPTLEDMISMFSETERLKPEESWYCSRCKDHVEATKKLELYRLPPILIIQLKRFVYTVSTYASSHRRSKDDRRVEYPLTALDLAPYLADGAEVGQNTTYDLCGVVCHSGSSYFGHYVSVGRLPGIDGRTTQIEWRQYDDSVVTKCPLPEVQSDEAYLLFYKQRGSTTRDLFRNHYNCDPIEDDTPFVETSRL
ncbi:unnamed protein product, partial [Mesorhabditis belari]|uniref:ubiquitinyl hydrolase 1 n=1 Tax=Mesorhabditis belari TaxID=2138241 RepID=A0AAF3EU99_9BILA